MKRRNHVELIEREIARIEGTDTIIVIEPGEGGFRAGFTEDGGATIDWIVAGARNANVALRDALLRHPHGRREERR